MKHSTASDLLRNLAQQATALADDLDKARAEPPPLLGARLLIAVDRARASLAKHGDPVKRHLNQEGER